MQVTKLVFKAPCTFPSKHFTENSNLTATYLICFWSPLQTKQKVVSANMNLKHRLPNVPLLTIYFWPSQNQQKTISMMALSLLDLIEHSMIKARSLFVFLNSTYFPFLKIKFWFGHCRLYLKLQFSLQNKNRNFQKEQQAYLVYCLW